MPNPFQSEKIIKLIKKIKKVSISDIKTNQTGMTRYRTTGWFRIGKGVHQGYILSPCFLNFYAVYIMQNAGLDEAQAKIKIAGICREISIPQICRWHHLYGRKQRRTKEPLGERRVKKLTKSSTFRKRRSWYPVPSLHGKWIGKQCKVTDFIFGGSKITADGDHEIKRRLLLGRKVMTNLDSIL